MLKEYDALMLKSHMEAVREPKSHKNRQRMMHAARTLICLKEERPKQSKQSVDNSFARLSLVHHLQKEKMFNDFLEGVTVG